MFTRDAVRYSVHLNEARVTGAAKVCVYLVVKGLTQRGIQSISYLICCIAQFLFFALDFSPSPSTPPPPPPSPLWL